MNMSRGVVVYSVWLGMLGLAVPPLLTPDYTRIAVLCNDETPLVLSWTILLRSDHKQAM